MKVRKYGLGDGGSLGWVKFSTEVKRNGEAGGGGMGGSAGSKSLGR